MPDKKSPREFKVGDHVIVSLAGGQIVEATVKAVVNRTDGVRLQVDYGKDETALVELWQVRTEEGRYPLGLAELRSPGSLGWAWSPSTVEKM